METVGGLSLVLDPNMAWPKSEEQPRFLDAAQGVLAAKMRELCSSCCLVCLPANGKGCHQFPPASHLERQGWESHLWRQGRACMFMFAKL